MAVLALKSLRAKMMVLLMLIAMIPIVLVGYICFDRARASLEQAEFGKLRLLWDSKHHELLAWFDGVIEDLTFVAQTNRLKAGFQESIKPDASSDKHAASMRGLNDVVNGYLDPKTAERGFEDILLLDGQTGKVLYGGRSGSDKGSSLRAGDLADSTVGQVWRQVMNLKRPVMSDFVIQPTTGSAIAAIGVPVYSLQTKECLGVAALRVNPNGMNKIFSLGSGAGKTGEVYLVGKDFLMRNQSSRFSREATGLHKKAETEPVKLAFAGKPVSMFSQGYDGETNLSVAALVGMNNQKDFSSDFDWAMVADLGEMEAMAGVRSLAWWVVCIGGLVAVAVVIIAFLVARGIAAPVEAVATVAQEVSRGNLTASLPDFKRDDEIGSLVDAFGTMTDALRNKIARIRDAVDILGAAAAQMSSSVSEVAASTTETSTAVTQTAATMEELRQAAELALDRAKTVAQTSQVAFQITQDTQSNAEDRVQRIHLIRDQMESIGEIVVRLSGQSQSVEEIIDTVKDLADQSNLLAVNASIEAARAGDHGKGFAVVAQEIKALADQSKQATDQVRGILEDSRKLVSAVVMAAEQGSKAVEAGVEQSARAQESIQRLSTGVTESAQAANVIEGIIHQQFAGVDQVSNAMTSIDQAMHQMIEGTEQVDHSAKHLAALGVELRQMVERYKV